MEQRQKGTRRCLIGRQEQTTTGLNLCSLWEKERKPVMRITMFSVGSRGDIQPMIELGRRLKQEGHTPLLATSPDFADLAAQYGIDFAPLGPPLSTFMNEELNKLVESGNMLKIMRYGM